MDWLSASFKEHKINSDRVARHTSSGQSAANDLIRTNLRVSDSEDQVLRIIPELAAKQV